MINYVNLVLFVLLGASAMVDPMGTMIIVAILLGVAVVTSPVWGYVMLTPLVGWAWAGAIISAYLFMTVFTFAVQTQNDPDPEWPPYAWSAAWPLYWLMCLVHCIGYRIHRWLV